MFQSSKSRLRAWMSRFDDLLGDHPDEAPARPDHFHTHPHRRPLRWERERRLGSVPPAPAHCISPVRMARDVSERPAPTR